MSALCQKQTSQIHQNVEKRNKRPSIDSTKGAAAPQCESPLFLRPEYQVPVFPICFRHRLSTFASTIASGWVGLFRTASWLGGGCFLNGLFLWRSIVLLIGFGFYFLSLLVIVPPNADLLWRRK